DPRRQPRDSLPALPSGRCALHAAHARGAGDRLQPHPRAARTRVRAGACAAAAVRAARGGRGAARAVLGLYSSFVAETETTSPAETEALAARVAGKLRPGDVVTIAGELGSGKTTFVRGACRSLGVTANVTSPTFTIGHRYAGDVPVSHLDLYRFAGLSHAEW